MITCTINLPILGLLCGCFHISFFKVGTTLISSESTFISRNFKNYFWSGLTALILFSLSSDMFCYICTSKNKTFRLLFTNFDFVLFVTFLTKQYLDFGNLAVYIWLISLSYIQWRLCLCYVCTSTLWTFSVHIEDSCQKNCRISWWHNLLVIWH